VIDDYHLISNPVIHDAMRFFLRHQPENMTLVVLSRNLPQLGIANLRVRDQLLEIGSQQLALPIRKRNSFSTVVSVRPLKPTTAAGCATMSPAGPPRCS
jgi:LuxR family maltose regulon positive regulatory protein